MNNKDSFKKVLIRLTRMGLIDIKVKLLVNEWFKTYDVLKVSYECFKNSSNVETIGMMTGIKINSLKDLRFRIRVLKNKGFVRDN